MMKLSKRCRLNGRNRTFRLLVKRPWTVSELLSIKDLKDWVMTSWPGADTSIPPCRQTHGSTTSAQERWEYFRDNQLKDYAKRRNQIVDPHAVSRISCYLNLGI